MHALSVVISVACSLAPAPSAALDGPASAAVLGQGQDGDEQDAAEDEAAARKAEQDAARQEREKERLERQKERQEREKERQEGQRQREEEKAQRVEELYEQGSEALDESQWDKALRAFDQVCKLGGRRCDGALYWKAYAQARRSRRAEAQATLAELKKRYPQTRWLGEAKALEQELGKAAGKPANPETEDDEELRLLALESLTSSNVERALSLLDEVLKSQGSPRLKDKALFVLSQTESPRARQLLLEIARGGNPDLQRRAVRYLGMSADAASLKVLAELYASASEPTVKRSILGAFVVADDAKHILAAAQAESDARLKHYAIDQLGAVGGVAELRQLYRNEASADLREEILSAFVAADAVDPLLEAARTEKEARLRIAAIHGLGALGSAATGASLRSLYDGERDPEVRGAILDAFQEQDNCRALIQIGRGEKDRALRKAVVEHLSSMECPEAADFLMEILKK